MCICTQVVESNNHAVTTKNHGAKKLAECLNGITRFTFVGAFWGMVLGWVREAALLGSVIGAFLMTSVFPVMRIQLALPIEILTPYPERGPRTARALNAL